MNLVNPKRFSRCCNKVERKYIQEQQPNQIHCYIQNMDFVNRMDQSVDNYRIEIQMKKWWWSPFVWMVDVVLHGARVLYRINKREGYKSLPFLVIWRHLPMQFFWNIQKKAHYPQAMEKMEISYQLFIMMSQNITCAIWTQAYWEPL